MTTPTQQLRDLLVSHEPWDPYAAALQLLDIVDKQQEQINRLQGIVDSQADRIRAIGLGLQRANGVHGA